MKVPELDLGMIVPWVKTYQDSSHLKFGYLNVSTNRIVPANSDILLQFLTDATLIKI